MHLLTVGEIARLNHMPEQTLRLYDRAIYCVLVYARKTAIAIMTSSGVWSGISSSI